MADYRDTLCDENDLLKATRHVCSEPPWLTDFLSDVAVEFFYDAAPSVFEVYHTEGGYQIGLRVSDDVEHLFTNDHGVLHREVGPARVVVSAASGSVVHRSWYRDGCCHRDGDLPAEAFIRSDLLTSIWRCHGLEHRATGPAMRRLYREGAVFLEWFLEGIECPSLAPLLRAVHEAPETLDKEMFSLVEEAEPEAAQVILKHLGHLFPAEYVEVLRSGLTIR